MADVEIRRATVTDAEELTAVYRSAYRENRELGFPATAGSVTPPTVTDWIRECRIYVAEIDAEIVGGIFECAYLSKECVRFPESINHVLIRQQP